MSLLAPSDFTGVFAQAKNEFTTPKIQLYIDRYEQIYLTELLGAVEYAAFIADLNPTPSVVTSVPTSAKFTVIFNAFAIDDGTGGACMHISEGIKAMLKFFVMFEYARDNQFDFAITGATKNNFSNSEIAVLNQTNAIDNYNMGVKTYNEIQWYILDNPVPYNYDDWNGQPKGYMSWP